MAEFSKGGFLMLGAVAEIMQLSGISLPIRDFLRLLEQQ